MLPGKNSSEEISLLSKEVCISSFMRYRDNEESKPKSIFAGLFKELSELKKNEDKNSEENPETVSKVMQKLEGLKREKARSRRQESKVYDRDYFSLESNTGFIATDLTN